MGAMSSAFSGGASGGAAASGAASSGGVMDAIGQGLVAAGGDEKTNDALARLNALQQQERTGAAGQQLRSDIMKYALQSLSR